MKIILLITACLAFLVLLNGADAVKPASFYGHDQVSAMLTKTTYYQRDPDLIVLGSHRDGPGQVEVHDKETDVMYIVDGSANMILGGTMIGGKRSAPDQWLGDKIEGGESHAVSKGDVLVIRAGVPHWFNEVPKSISYFVVKTVK